ncbi:MAG: SLC26A/SulP transporter family protein [Burkholderiales bacterium]|nr:SLC26A/SulP transporter family protein [Burkholderiales bacterium]
MGKNMAGDVWGGLAAMLVALPSAIAFGVTVYAPLGGTQAAQGAMAGILGAMALGLVAASLGGAPRLISAPCAPAVAIFSAFALERLAQGSDVAAIVLMLTLVGLLAGGFQVLFGVLRVGHLIKYMPYPVVSGYLSGVGLIIIGSQIPKLLGTTGGLTMWAALVAPVQWNMRSLLIGAVTAAVMVWAPRVVKAVPAAILGLLAGVLAYLALGLAGLVPMVAGNNVMLVGPLTGGDGSSFLTALGTRWQAAAQMDLGALVSLLFPALTLAGLLSIDTLKTCVVLDAMTRSRHDSNRELIAQGCGNLCASVVGGMPGAGTMGATLVNLSSGAVSRWSGMFEGMAALAAFALLGGLIAWVPVAALAAILIVIGVRMIDRSSLHFLHARATLLDFLVILSVVTTALTVSLIAASAVGVLLAIMLFIREQVSNRVVRRRLLGSETFSKRVRTRDEMASLVRHGEQVVVCELQGSLFFGTTQQLYSALEADLKTRRFVILDMRRVQTVDVTAAHMLEQVREMLAERDGRLILADIPARSPSGLDIKAYLVEAGLLVPHAEGHRVKVFPEVDTALEWTEDLILNEAALTPSTETALELHEMELFRQRNAQTLVAMEACMERRTVQAGGIIFSRGDAGDELFLIRRGAVRIVLPVSDTKSHHLGTFGRGSFFGEMSFLDGAARSADAVAFSQTDLYVLSRKVYNQFAEAHRKTALDLMEGIASTLASRLRYTTAELRVLES